jgi:micrococcal nuclease
VRQKLFLPLVILVGLLIAFIFGTKFALVEQTSNQNPPSEKGQKQSTSDSEKTGHSSSKNTDEVLVKKVIDGDTVELEGGTRLRYIGIDTPETVDPKQPVQCFGKEATAKNKELVEGKKVRLETDVSNEDRFGRLLRYVYVGETFVNEYLVKEGFARASSYPPDIKYQDKLSVAEKAARDLNKGLWGGCASNVQGSTSQNYSVSLSPGEGCKIKGNISSSGEKIYHLPNGSYYDKTVIDESKGERWFCSEEEAKAAGWRASKV